MSDVCEAHLGGSVSPYGTTRAAMAAPAPVNPEQMRAIAEMLKAAPAGAVAAIVGAVTCGCRHRHRDAARAQTAAILARATVFFLTRSCRVT
jgi:hypothetical protein